MFDLEQAIAEWRKQMLAAGIKAPVPLEELELHLRDEIEQQMKLGANTTEAFGIATQKLARQTRCKTSSGKLRWRRRSVTGDFLNGSFWPARS
jgi:hypothetical protein